MKMLEIKNYLQKNYIKIFFVFVFVIFMAKGVILIYPDLNLLYPYMFNDSWDWIANGFYYVGYNVNYSVRAPGLPLIIMLLEKNNILNLLPLLNQLVLFGIYCFLYKILKLYFSRVVSFAVILILFFNFFLQNFSLYILADLYALFFILLGVFYYLKADKNAKFYLLASLFWSISFLFQYAFVFIIPAIIIHFLIFRRNTKKKYLIYAFLTAILIISPWFIYRRIKFGDFLYTKIAQIELFNFHLDGIFYYFIGLIAILGLFAFLILCIGLIDFALKCKNNYWQNKKPRLQFFVLTILISIAWFIFWVLFYDWNDRRFLLYLLPFILPFIALSINLFIKYYKNSRLLAKISIVLLFILCIIWTAIPYRHSIVHDELRLTPKQVLKFTVSISSNKARIGFPFSLAKASNEYNPLNIYRLYNAKKVDFSELDSLNRIKKEFKKNSISYLCVEYAKQGKPNWYPIKNRYRNFFRLEFDNYPNCKNPNLRLTDIGLEKL